MATVLRFEISNVAIGNQLLPSLRQNANEWIVGGVNHYSRGTRNPLYHIRGSGPSVVIVGSRKPAIVRRYAIVELPQVLTPRRRDASNTSGNNRALRRNRVHDARRAAGHPAERAGAPRRDFGLNERAVAVSTNRAPPGPAASAPAYKRSSIPSCRRSRALSNQPARPFRTPGCCRPSAPRPSTGPSRH